MWADGLFQLAEAPGAVHQLPQDQYLPFVADEHQGGLDGQAGNSMIKPPIVSFW